MIFINTFESTASHLAAMRTTIRRMGYDGTKPIVVDILYDDGTTRNQKYIYAYSSPPPGLDDRCLFLNMNTPQLYRLATDGYTKVYSFIDGYFKDSPLQTVEDVQQFIQEQVTENIGEQIPQSVIDDIAQQVTDQVTQQTGFGVIPVQTLSALSLLDNVSLLDKEVAFVENENAFFHLDLQSNAATDGIDILPTKTGAGRWIRVKTDSQGNTYIPVQAISNLSAMDNSAMPDKTIAFVENENAFFHLDLQSNVTIDNINVVATHTGAGRWIRVDHDIDGGTY